MKAPLRPWRFLRGQDHLLSRPSYPDHQTGCLAGLALGQRSWI